MIGLFIIGLDQWNFVLHPVHSSVTCDPDGSFVRRWIPELSSLPTEDIHQPWSCPPDELDRLKVYLGKNYPNRIILNLEQCREGSLRDVTEARRNYGKGFIDDLNGRDRMVSYMFIKIRKDKRIFAGDSSKVVI